MKYHTYQSAIKERDKLTEFIYLIENYNVDTFESWVIKQYAINGSITGVIKQLASCPFATNNFPNNRDSIKSIILNSSKDELHKVVQKQYRSKARYKKNK